MGVSRCHLQHVEDPPVPRSQLPVPYHPNHVPLVYNGKPMKLTPVQEQMVYPVYRRWDKMDNKEKQNWLESFRQLSGLKSGADASNPNGSENADDAGNASNAGRERRKWIRRRRRD